jgi:RimJ/RimL family protein N-acetyltransferase
MRAVKGHYIGRRVGDLTIMTSNVKDHVIPTAVQPFVLTTARLQLREVHVGDAAAICGLLNDPAFLQYIGDRQVRTEGEAQEYIRRTFLHSYKQNGFGLWHISWRQPAVTADEQRLVAGGAHPQDSAPEMLGLCGLVKRDGLEDVDLGYALFPHARGQGVVQEAAAAVLRYASQIGLSRLAAIVQPENMASIHTLQQLGFTAQGHRSLPGSAQVLAYYVRELTS